MDIQEHEKKAALAGGKQAGQYLDSIGKTDLATLTSEEWGIFCAVLCVNYHLNLQVE